MEQKRADLGWESGLPRRSSAGGGGLDELRGEGAEALTEDIADRVCRPGGCARAGVGGEKLGDLGRSESGDGAEGEDDAGFDGKAVEPVANALAIGAGHHALELVAGDSRGVEVIVVDAAGGRNRGGGCCEASRTAALEKFESGSGEGATTADAGLAGVAAGGDFDLCDGCLDEMHAVFAFADEHGGETVETGGDEVESGVVSGEGLADGGVVFWPAIEEAADLRSEGTRLSRDGHRRNEAIFRCCRAIGHARALSVGSQIPCSIVTWRGGVGQCSWRNAFWMNGMSCRSGEVKKQLNLCRPAEGRSDGRRKRGRLGITADGEDRNGQNDPQAEAF